MRFVLAMLSATALALAVGLIHGEVNAASPRLVLALYYPWYNLDTWSDPALSDRPAVPYDGSDPVAIARHVGWAREAGIDVLVSAWYGPSGDNPTESNFRKLLDAADRAGVKAAVMLETDSIAFFPDLESQRTAIAHALAVHAKHPAYFRYDGRPVIFVWRPAAIWLGDTRSTRGSRAVVEAWQALRDSVDPGRSSVWIAEGDYMGYLAVFDGIFPYSIAWSADPARQLQRYGEAVRQFTAATGVDKLWIATAMPGYDDTRLWERSGRFAVDRRNGDYYRSTLEAAVASGPDWINISSFNEWLEDHQIEPSITYGSFYLDLTREFALWWKAVGDLGAPETIPATSGTEEAVPIGSDDP